MNLTYKEGDVVFLRHKMYLVCAENMRKLKKCVLKLKPVGEVESKVFKTFGLTELKVNSEFQERVKLEYEFLYRFDKVDMRKYIPTYVLFLKEARTYKRFRDLFQEIETTKNQTNYAYRYFEMDNDILISDLISTYFAYDKLNMSLAEKERAVKAELAKKLQSIVDELSR